MVVDILGTFQWVTYPFLHLMVAQKQIESCCISGRGRWTKLDFYFRILFAELSLLKSLRFWFEDHSEKLNQSILLVLIVCSMVTLGFKKLLIFLSLIFVWCLYNICVKKNNVQFVSYTPTARIRKSDGGDLYLNEMID